MVIQHPDGLQFTTHPNGELTIRDNQGEQRLPAGADNSVEYEADINSTVPAKVTGAPGSLDQPWARQWNLSGQFEEWRNGEFTYAVTNVEYTVQFTWTLSDGTRATRPVKVKVKPKIVKPGAEWP